MAALLLTAHLGVPRTSLRACRSRSGVRQPPQASRMPLRAVCFTTAGGQEAPKAPAAAGTVGVTFSLVKQVAFGQNLAVVGDAEALGGWEVGRAPQLRWGEGDVWSASVELPAGATLNYKFIVQQGPGQPPLWEDCNNRTLAVDPAAAQLSCVWGQPLATSWLALAAQQAAATAELAAAEDDEASALSEDDAPAPAFKPALAMAQVAEAVRQSLGTMAAEGEGAAEEGAAAPAPAATEQQQQADCQEEQLQKDKAEQKQQQKKKEGQQGVTLSAEAEAAVGELIGAAGGAELAPAAEPVAPPGGSNNTLKTLGQAAGAVAMGVAATAVFSALAIDVADVAMLGALGAGSIAAWSTPSSAKRRGSASTGSSSDTGAAIAAELGTVELGAAAGEAELAPSAEEATPAAVPAVDEVQLIGSKGSAPGVILAAGLLSAFDAGKSILAPGNGSGSSKGASKGGKQAADREL